MASLVDFARTINAQVKPSQAHSAASSSPPSELSLVDVARQQKQKDEKPRSLLDATRTFEPPRVGTSSQPSLTVIARNVNEEERQRMDAVITKVADEVKEEQRRNREDLLKTAAMEVREQSATKTIQSSNASTLPSVKESIKRDQTDAPVPKTVEVDEPGYSTSSSFEDEDVPKKETKRSGRTKSKESANEDDNQSEAERGIEKTEASDSLESKEYLRAVYRGDLRRMQDMTDGSAELNADTADQHGWSALHWAASQGHTQILSYLLNHKPRINAVEHLNGWTALHVAVARDSAGCVKRLLQAGASLQVPDRYDDTVIDIARMIKGKRGERMLRILEEHRTKRDHE